jgi:hypothetical protein
MVGQAVSTHARNELVVEIAFVLIDGDADFDAVDYS